MIFWFSPVSSLALWCRLVRLPTVPRRIFSMTITNSCVAGREMPRTRNQSKHIHDNLPRDRVCRQTAAHLKSRHHNPPNYLISYYGLSTFFVSNIRMPTQKPLICNTVLSIRASPQTVDIKAAPQFDLMMSKEP